MQPSGVVRHYAEIMDDRARMLEALEGVLAEVGADHVLVGGLAVGYHGRPRATIDVDLLVPRKKLPALARALKSRGYVVRSTDDMIRVYEHGADPSRDDAVADLVGRESNPVLRAAAKETQRATILGHRVNVVSRGALVALKFHAATSPKRRIEDRYQDIADIGRVVAKRFTQADVSVAHRLAEQIYRGAGKEMDQLVDDLRHGRPVKL